MKTTKEGWIIPDAYSKEDVVSKLIWIQEFLNELQEYGWSEPDHPDLARKYSKSIDMILEFIELNSNENKT